MIFPTSFSKIAVEEEVIFRLVMVDTVIVSCMEMKFIGSKQTACAFVAKGRKENHLPNGMKTLLG